MEFRGKRKALLVSDPIQKYFKVGICVLLVFLHGSAGVRDWLHVLPGREPHLSQMQARMHPQSLETFHHSAQQSEIYRKIYTN